MKSCTETKAWGGGKSSLKTYGTLKAELIKISVQLNLY